MARPRLAEVTQAELGWLGEAGGTEGMGWPVLTTPSGACPPSAGRGKGGPAPLSPWGNGLGGRRVVCVRWRAVAATAQLPEVTAWFPLRNPGQQFGRDSRAVLAMVRWGGGGSEGGACLPAAHPPPGGDASVAMVTRCPAQGHPDLSLNPQRLSLLLLLLLLPGLPPALGMEDDASFPHLGESSQPPPRACPPRCSCPRPDTVDCDGLDLRVFPDNITRAAQHLSLQVGPACGYRAAPRVDGGACGVSGFRVRGPHAGVRCWACGS